MRSITQTSWGQLSLKLFLSFTLLIAVLQTSVAGNDYNDDCVHAETTHVKHSMESLLSDVLIEKIHIYSLEGDEIAEINMSSATDLLCFASMNPGEYVFKVYTPDGTFIQSVKIPKYKRQKK